MEKGIPWKHHHPTLRLAKVDQPALQGGGGGLGSVSHAELAENVIDVTLDSRFADAQAGTNFLIALTAHDQFEHFHLSAGQIGARHSLGEPFGDGSRDVTRSGVNVSDCSLEFLEEDVF